MFKVVIKKNNVETNDATFETQELVDNWLAQEQNNKSFGKNAGEYQISELNESELATEISRRFAKDLNGNDTENVLVTIPNQYDVVIEDITETMQAQKDSEEALAYLAATDYLVTRFVETKVDYPQEIKDKRAEARKRVL